MASKVISFRFGSAELEALQALQLPEDESINQTAAILLRGLIDTSTVVSTSVDIKELVRQEVLATIAPFRREVEVGWVSFLNPTIQFNVGFSNTNQEERSGGHCPPYTIHLAI
ncbi:hypothetical protein NUACC21_23930 [Scytonema sp. NUACC21]